MRIRLNLLVLAFAAIQLLPSLLGYQSAHTKEASLLVRDSNPVAHIRLPLGSVGLFRWNDDTVAVLRPRDKLITLYTIDPSRKPKFVAKTIPLKGSFSSGEAPIYPDLAVRHESGDVYWLSRSTNRIAIYSESGHLKNAFFLRSNDYSWFEVKKDKTIVAHATGLDMDMAGYEVYSQDGRFSRAEPTWLQVRKEHKRLSSAFFFDLQQGNRLEILTSYPYVRTSAPKSVRQILCDALGPDFREQFELAKNNDELPAPLGSGRNVVERLSPFALGAARSAGDDVFVLLNGGVVVRLNNGSARIDCWRLPPPEAAQYVPTSITVAGGFLGILTQSADDLPELRIWDLARSETKHDTGEVK